MARGSLTQLPGSCPITWFVIGANAVTFIVAFVGGGSLWEFFIFRTSAIVEAPWSILTYPLIGAGGILWVLLGGYMMWLFGGSLERAWAAADYARFRRVGSPLRGARPPCGTCRAAGTSCRRGRAAGVRASRGGVNTAARSTRS